MINSTMNPTAPLPKADDLGTLMRLVDLLADPKASKQRIAELRDAAAAAEQASAKAATERAATDTARIVAEQTIADKEAAHEAKIEREMTAHASVMAQREAELDKREGTMKAVAAKANADASAAEVAKQEIQRRLRAMEGN